MELRLGTEPTLAYMSHERVFGSMCFGIGTQGSHLGGKGWDASGHSDGIAFASVYLAGEPLEEAGRYVHPDGVDVCERICAPGY
jgi:hypothetical protein